MQKETFKQPLYPAESSLHCKLYFTLITANFIHLCSNLAFNTITPLLDIPRCKEIWNALYSIKQSELGGLLESDIKKVLDQHYFRLSQFDKGFEEASNFFVKSCKTVLRTSQRLAKRDSINWCLYILCTSSRTIILWKRYF